MNGEYDEHLPDDPILRKLYQRLQGSPGMLISRMYNERWSYTGGATADGLWLTTDQVRALFAAGVIEQVPINNVSFEEDLQFKCGSFRVVMPECPQTYNQVRLRAVVAICNHHCAVEVYRVLDAPPCVIARITGTCFEARDAVATLTELVEHGYDLHIETDYRDVPETYSEPDNGD